MRQPENAKHSTNLSPLPLAGGQGGGGSPRITTRNTMRHSTRNPALKNNARSLKKNMTLAEQRLWYYLRGKQLNSMKFRRQQTIGKYIVDFVCMECNID